MRKRNVPHELQYRVKKYFEFVWKQEREEDAEQEALFMNKLSSKLRQEMNYHNYIKYLRAVPAFQIFSDQTLINLSNCMKMVRFSPEETVYKVIIFIKT